MERPAQIKKDKKLLVLTCPICKCMNSRQLSVATAANKVSDWANIAVYLDCMTLCDDSLSPKAGDVLDVWVKYPVCCRRNELFSATIDYDGDYLTMKMLKIKKHCGSLAKLLVKVVERCNRLVYVKPVPEDVKLRLKYTRAYNYVAPGGDSLGGYGYISENVVHFGNSFGGDVWDDDYVFTDEDGIDHLVQQCYKDFDRKESYYGDKVLGYHQYSPYFPPPEILPDGTLAPTLPFGFMERFKRRVEDEGGVAPLS